MAKTKLTSQEATVIREVSGPAIPVYESEQELAAIWNKASAREKRAIENFVLSKPLSQINAPDHLHFLARLIQDHDHFAEKLQSESNRRLRQQKYDAMKPYLNFRAHKFAWYELPPSERGHLWIPHYA